MQIDLCRLKNEIANRYIVDNMGDWSQIVNGDECLVWRVENGTNPLIVRVSPNWRTIEELQWVHDFTLHCRQTIPEAVAPVTTCVNSTLFVFESYPVTVFPFVEGDSLNTDNPALCQKAARLLARIHKAAATWHNKHSRPASKATRPEPLSRAEYPPVFQDAEFDAWEAELADSNLTIMPIHGDYYSRNVLATDERITGVIDWDEADINYLMAEVGWSVWEFAQVDSGDDLDDDKARAFLAAYFDEDPPCPKAEIQHTVNFIRLRLRNEAVADLARKARGEAWDMEYTEGEIRAFVALQNRVIAL